MTRSFLVAGLMLVCALAVRAQAQNNELKAETRTLSSPGSCADFSDLGTSTPKLLNLCPNVRTVRVVNYDRNANKVADRVFHLWHKEVRPVASPGYQMFIDSEEGWSNAGSDDGAHFIDLTHRDVGGSDLWEAKNRSPDRFNAAQFIVYENGRRKGASWIVLPPGQGARMYAFTPPNTGALVLEWSRLDPR